MTAPPNPAARVNAPFPGAGGAGLIETVKRAVVLGLRDAVTGTTLNGLVNGSEITVDMEYPAKVENYPGIWVQFSFSEMVNSGIGHEILTKRVLEDETINWEPVREVQFRGRVSLTIVALTSLERDRISDAVISSLLFSRPPEYVLTNPTKDTKQFRQLIAHLAKNPYVSMTINHDELIPGGQSMTVGAPWDQDLPVYEDTYSFDILGQTNITFRSDGTYTLRAVVDAGEMEDPPNKYEWH